MKAGIVLFAVATLVPISSSAEQLYFTTEEYAPFNFTVNGELRGYGADQVQEILKRTGIKHTIEVTAWSRAIGLAKSKKNHCVFTASHTPERDQQFVWVEPLVKEEFVLARTTESTNNPQSLEAAKQFTVGVQNGDYTQELLTSLGFSNVDAAKTMDQTMKKLEADRVDFIAVSGSFLYDMASKGHELQKVLTLSETIMAIACHPDTDKQLIDQMNTALNEMIKDGTQKKIIQAY